MKGLDLEAKPRMQSKELQLQSQTDGVGLQPLLLASSEALSNALDFSDPLFLCLSVAWG